MKPVNASTNALRVLLLAVVTLVLTSVSAHAAPPAHVPEKKAFSKWRRENRKIVNPIFRQASREVHLGSKRLCAGAVYCSIMATPILPVLIYEASGRSVENAFWSAMMGFTGWSLAAQNVFNVFTNYDRALDKASRTTVQTAAQRGVSIPPELKYWLTTETAGTKASADDLHSSTPKLVLPDKQPRKN